MHYWWLNSLTQGGCHILDTVWIGAVSSGGLLFGNQGPLYHKSWDGGVIHDQTKYLQPNLTCIPDLFFGGFPANSSCSTRITAQPAEAG